MYVKLSPKNLNPNHCLSHSTNIYTCEVTTARGGHSTFMLHILHTHE